MAMDSATRGTRSGRPETTGGSPARKVAGEESRRPTRVVRYIHESAGAVVIIDGRCLALRRNQEWVLPKGHLECGERPEEAAAREVREEAGIWVRIVQPIGATSYEFETQGGKLHRKRVQWFLAEKVGGTMRAHAPFAEASLLDRDQAASLLTHEADRDLAAQAFEEADRLGIGRETTEDRTATDVFGGLVPDEHAPS
jgi:ADP-ribose pyrophosphatase YjhB (NUDIX family)